MILGGDFDFFLRLGDPVFVDFEAFDFELLFSLLLDLDLDLALVLLPDFGLSLELDFSSDLDFLSGSLPLTSFLSLLCSTFDCNSLSPPTFGILFSFSTLFFSIALFTDSLDLFKTRLIFLAFSPAISLAGLFASSNN